MIMNTKLYANSIKNALVSAIAVSMITLPLLASANEESLTFLDSKDSLNNTKDVETLYARLKNASRDMCGSSNLQLTGSVERVMGNEKCYEGTLTAAVERLGNEKVMALHRQES
jgi:UrcA family protein